MVRWVVTCLKFYRIFAELSLSIFLRMQGRLMFS